MSKKLSDIQVRWQSAAVEILLAKAGDYDRGPWIPADEAVAAVRGKSGCTHQAAIGALRALLMVGLADRSEASQGSFWRATDAAERADDLLLGPFTEQLAAIETRLVSIDRGLDEIFKLQNLRLKLQEAV